MPFGLKWVRSWTEEGKQKLNLVGDEDLLSVERQK